MVFLLFLPTVGTGRVTGKESGYLETLLFDCWDDC